jgi:transglutaminase-like putative cysteine protease
MAVSKPEKDTAGRLLLLTSLVALAVVAAFAFGRVFTGTGTSAKLGLAAGIAVLLAGAVERRHVAIATLVSLAGLAVAVGLLVFPATTKFGLPTLATFRQAYHAFGAVSRLSEAEVAPATPLPALFLAGLTAVWAAAFSAHTLAVRARSPFLAILPPAALVAFTGMILDDGARPLYVLAFLIAIILMLFADSLRRVGEWGPMVAWRGRRRLGFGTHTTTRGARRVAAVCLGVALFTPWILPGLHSPGIIKLNGTSSPSHISVDPIVDIRPQLLANPAVEVFTVRSSKAAYWRFQTLDRFTGRLWLPARTSASTLITGQSSQVQLGSGIGIDSSAGTVVSAHVRVERLRQISLPAPYLAVAFGGNRDPIQYDPASATLMAPNGTYDGFSYDVTALAEGPKPTDLDALGNFGTNPNSTPSTQLPSDMPSQISRIAHRLTDGFGTTYQKVMAIQNYLLGNFRYDEHVKAGHSTNDILYFLNVSRAGFCEQFAGTMAVLLRELGIPARVAVGFTPGSLDKGAGVYRVETSNAHAWVEVQFPRYGWLPFEPTPGRINPIASAYDVRTTVGAGLITGPQCLISARDKDNCVQATPAQTPAARPISHSRPGGGHPVPPPKVTARRSWPARNWKWLLMGGLLVLLGALPFAKTTVRRIEVARARAPNELVFAAYRRLMAEAADLGWRRLRAETMWEFRTRLRDGVAALDGDDLDRLTRLTAAAVYGQSAVTEHEADEAVAASERVADDIRRSSSIPRRVLGRFWVGSADSRR